MTLDIKACMEGLAGMCDKEAKNTLKKKILWTTWIPRVSGKSDL